MKGEGLAFRFTTAPMKPIHHTRIPFSTTILIISTLLLSCELLEPQDALHSSSINLILAGPYEGSGSSWFSPETTYYAFESKRDEASTGSTYYTANNRTLMFFPDDKDDTTSHSIYIAFPGRTSGLYPTSRDTVMIFLDLSTTEYPVSFISSPDSSGGAISVDQYSGEGGRIAGTIDCRMRVLGPITLYWKLCGTFSARRQPDNTTDRLFEP